MNAMPNPSTSPGWAAGHSGTETSIEQGAFKTPCLPPLQLLAQRSAKANPSQNPTDVTTCLKNSNWIQ